jgi:hypothetical protein
MTGPVAVALAALAFLALVAVAVLVEARRRPLDDLDETDTLPRMGRALK